MQPERETSEQAATTKEHALGHSLLDGLKSAGIRLLSEGSIPGLRTPESGALTT